MHEPFLFALWQSAEQLNFSSPAAVPSACLHRAHTSSCCWSDAHCACMGAAYVFSFLHQQADCPHHAKHIDPAPPAFLLCVETSSCCMCSGPEAAALDPRWWLHGYRLQSCSPTVPLGSKCWWLAVVTVKGAAIVLSGCQACVNALLCPVLNDNDLGGLGKPAAAGLGG